MQIENTSSTIKRCPQCGEIPTLGYACGEYFIYHSGKNEGECFCSSFDEMHSNEWLEIAVWNRAVDKTRGEYENC